MEIQDLVKTFKQNTRACAAEFIGVFALVFVGMGAIASDMITGGQTTLLGVALAHGLTIAVMVTVFMNVSGGHLNPAVTIGMLVTKRIDGVLAIAYIIAQYLGGLAGAVAIQTIIVGEVPFGTGVPALARGISPVVGLLLEVILTFFLVLSIFGTAVDKSAPKMGGLFIGLTVTLGILVGGPISGAAMNPARHLGPAIFGGGLGSAWLYTLGPIIGGVIAAFVYEQVIEKK
ncbi:MAG: aquaporin TIP [Candidatus Omnitrophota bacterium]|jgi:aquaporin TIP